MAQLDSEEKNTVCGWIKSAKYLRQALLRRKIMLNTIGDLLIQTQAPYFSQEGEILPLSIRDLAQELKVHPSTAWRAVTDKVLACPRGMIPLKMFFSCEGSKNSVREILRKLINQEDRAKPLTDEALAKKLQEQGIQCARRTIAHYRNSLKLRASKRRIHK
jgi:RNA polymerase sigma-54 factor